MSESAPPGLANDAPDGAAQTLTPEAVAVILADFQAWLMTAAEAGAVESPVPVEGERIDLHTLLGQFVALRHEVNLQTRATRAQQEQNAETLRVLADVVESLEDKSNATPQAGEADPDTRPLLKTLVDLHDALTVGGREVGRVQETVAPLLRNVAELTAPYPLDETLLRLPAAVSGWRHWFGGEPSPADATTKKLVETMASMYVQETVRAQQVREQLDRLGQMIASLAAGYTMSLQRVERALQQHELEPMTVLGTPFDPEQMEVVDVAHNTGRPAGEVVEEVRRGYQRDGRIFRYAQVRVAKS